MARQFLASGDFLWNSGIFIWSLSSLMTAMKQQLPDINAIFSEGAECLLSPIRKTNSSTKLIQKSGISPLTMV